MIGLLVSMVLVSATKHAVESPPRGECLLHRSGTIECLGATMAEIVRVFNHRSGDWTFTIISPDRCKAVSSIYLHDSAKERIEFLKHAAGGEYPLIRLALQEDIRSALITCLR
jgi:hypothetical protein